MTMIERIPGIRVLSVLEDLYERAQSAQAEGSLAYYRDGASPLLATVHTSFHGDYVKLLLLTAVEDRIVFTEVDLVESDRIYLLQGAPIRAVLPSGALLSEEILQALPLHAGFKAWLAQGRITR